MLLGINDALLFIPFFSRLRYSPTRSMIVAKCIQTNKDSEKKKKNFCVKSLLPSRVSSKLWHFLPSCFLYFESAINYTSTHCACVYVCVRIRRFPRQLSQLQCFMQCVYCVLSAKMDSQCLPFCLYNELICCYVCIHTLALNCCATVSWKYNIFFNCLMYCRCFWREVKVVARRSISTLLKLR